MQVKAISQRVAVTLMREGLPVQIRVGAVADDLVGQVVRLNKYAEPVASFPRRSRNMRPTSGSSTLHRPSVRE